MNNKLSISLATLGLIIAGVVGFILLSPNSSNQTSNQKGIKVATSIFPLYDITKNIGGEKISVYNVVPAGASPHTFQLKPSDIKKIQGTQIAFIIGHDLDTFIEPTISQNSDAKIVTVDQNIKLEEFGNHKHEHNNEEDHRDENEDEHEEGDEDDHGHEGTDPHYWLSINNAKIIAENIANELSTLDPVNSNYYQDNLKSYQEELDELSQEVSTILVGANIENIIVFHDSWTYFAKENNLKIAGVFEPSPGKEPSPQYLKELYDTAQDNNISVVFTEPQLSSNAVNPFVQDLGLEIHTLDPIGGLDDRDSYINLMRYNAQIIKNAYAN